MATKIFLLTVIYCMDSGSEHCAALHGQGYRVISVVRKIMFLYIIILWCQNYVS